MLRVQERNTEALCLSPEIKNSSPLGCELSPEFQSVLKEHLHKPQAPEVLLLLRMGPTSLLQTGSPSPGGGPQILDCSVKLLCSPGEVKHFQKSSRATPDIKYYTGSC